MQVNKPKKRNCKNSSRVERKKGAGDSVQGVRGGKNKGPAERPHWRSAGRLQIAILGSDDIPSRNKDHQHQWEPSEKEGCVSQKRKREKESRGSALGIEGKSRNGLPSIPKKGHLSPIQGRKKVKILYPTLSVGTVKTKQKELQKLVRQASGGKRKLHCILARGGETWG